MRFLINKKMNYITKIVFAVFLVLVSCEKDDDKRYAKMLSQEECNLVLIYSPSNSVWFEMIGYHPNTKERMIIKTHNRWWNMFANEMDEGDTIIKKKGKLVLEIHKKDSIIYNYWKIGETYRKVFVRKSINY